MLDSFIPLVVVYKRNENLPKNIALQGTPDVAYPFTLLL
jgi:hypothetical protein